MANKWHRITRELNEKGYSPAAIKERLTGKCPTVVLQECLNGIIREAQKLKDFDSSSKGKPKRCGPKGQRNRRLIYAKKLRALGNPGHRMYIAEFHATKGWRYYRA